MIFVKTRSDPKYLLDSLFYLAGSQAPYIHVILISDSESPQKMLSNDIYSGGQNCSNVFHFWNESPVSLEIKY